MSDTETPPEVSEPETPTDPRAEPEPEPETYPAEHVRELRHDVGKYRQKAKKVDDANARLVSAYATSDGRLVDVQALAFTDALLDDDGLVDREKVAEAISALVTAKPYLQSRTPQTSIPQGARAETPTVAGLFAAIRERA